MTKEVYVNQLSIEAQEMIVEELRNYLYQEFLLTGIDLDIAIQEALQSKVSDVEYIMVV